MGPSYGRRGSSWAHRIVTGSTMTARPSTTPGHTSIPVRTDVPRGGAIGCGTGLPSRSGFHRLVSRWRAQRKAARTRPSRQRGNQPSATVASSGSASRPRAQYARPSVRAARRRRPRQKVTFGCRAGAVSPRGRCRSRGAGPVRRGRSPPRHRAARAADGVRGPSLVHRPGVEHRVEHGWVLATRAGRSPAYRPGSRNGRASRPQHRARRPTTPLIRSSSVSPYPLERRQRSSLPVAPPGHRCNFPCNNGPWCAVHHLAEPIPSVEPGRPPRVGEAWTHSSFHRAHLDVETLECGICRERAAPLDDARDAGSLDDASHPAAPTQHRAELSADA